MTLIGNLRTNILDVDHHRFGSDDTPFGYVDATLTLETRGAEHIRQIVGVLEANGYQVTRSS